MNIRKPLSVAVIFCFSSIIVFGTLAYFVHVHDVLLIDRRVIDLVQGMESARLTALMKFLSLIGSAPVVVVLSLLILYFLYKVLKHRHELVLFIGVMVGSPLLNILLKELFERARPEFRRLIEISGYSFPSGHAMNAFTFYGIFTFLLWRHIPVVWGRMVLLISSGIMIVGIGISRIYLGVHYPTDIIGGYFASATWLGFSIWTFQWYKDRQAIKNTKLQTG
ncbi:phosphatase PAP2 family protein [Fredinandcohnia sp. FSL W7-1320]|uniref:phosphatase PAP2 family protein n=1 Tax=Fredinandcohnia sp. FSL W7-1320 TaxID=2954540 RepID=UPI0030FDD2DE